MKMFQISKTTHLRELVCNQFPRFPSKTTLLVLFVIFSLAMIFYSRSLNNDFIHDDLGQVVHNEYAHSLNYLPKVITGCIWESALGGCYERSDYYRPVQSLSYLLTYQFSQNAWLFHLINLFYFILSAFLVYALTKEITGKFALSLLSSVLFAINPINSEVVNWISAVPDLTFGIFIPLAVIFHFKYRKNSSKNNLYLVYLFYFLGMLSKEPAAFLPAVLIFIDKVFFEVKFFNFRNIGLPKNVIPSLSKDPIEENNALSNGALRQAQHDNMLTFDIPGRSEARRNGGDKKNRFNFNVNFNRGEAKNYLVFPILFLTYFFMRAAVLGFGNGVRHYGELSSAERIYAFFSLFGQYLLKAFYSYPLNFFYKFEKSSAFLSLEFLFYFLLFLIFVFLLCALVKRKEKIPALAMVWFFVFISPAVFFLDSLGENVFSERYMYVPVMGSSIAVSYVFFKLAETRSLPDCPKKTVIARSKATKQSRIYRLNTRLLRSFQSLAMTDSSILRQSGITNFWIVRIMTVWIMALALFIWAGYSWIMVSSRNEQWKNNETLFNYTLKQNPDARPLRYNLSVVYKTRGDWEKAKEGWEILEGNSKDWIDIGLVYNNLGDYHRIKGDLDKAIEYYRKAAEAGARKGNPKGYNNLGALYLEKGNYLDSIANFCRAAELNPEIKEAEENFGLLVHIIESLDEDDLPALYEDLTHSSTFKKSDEKAVKYKKSDCDQDKCRYVFVFYGGKEQSEIALSFLIMARNSSNKMIKLESYSFDKDSGEMNLDISSKDNEERISFLIPTCRGVYYEAESLLSNSSF